MFLWLLGREFKVRCPDGTVRFVMRDPHDAFPLLAKDWTTKAAASADSVAKLKANANIEVAAKVDQLLFQLDGKNASVQQKCCAVYVVYKGNPCGTHDWLQNQVKQILAEEACLRRFDACVEQVRIAVDAKLPAAQVLSRLDHAILTLKQSDAELQREEQFKKAPSLADKWCKEPVR